MIIVAKIGKPMITARYATSSSVLCDGSQAIRSVVPWTRYPTPAAHAVAKIPYDSTAIPTWIVSSGAFWRAGTSGSISDGSELA